MHNWRITKYNPIFRNKNGDYLKNEWTAFSDIGESFENEKLTFEKYLKTEDAYIAAVILFLECNELDSLTVTHLEKTSPLKNSTFYSKEMINIFNEVKEGLLVNKNLIESIARLILRETFWCKLESEKMYVHFGWDYYMYIESTNFCEKDIEKIEQSGLFVEQFQSPYEHIE